jgi:hypothetical protein
MNLFYFFFKKVIFYGLPFYGFRDIIQRVNV